MDATHTAPSEAPQTFDPVPFSRDEPDTIFLLTSLTAASSSIITATARLEHILKSNKITFKAVDLATDEKARRLWQWKGKGKRLPGVAKNGEVLGCFEDIEDWNEYGELRQQLGVSKKKKKKKSPMDGSTAPANPSTTASPNFVPERESGPSNPAGGVPTAFSQAGIAAAAAAAGKKRIKKKVAKGDTKKSPAKETDATLKAVGAPVAKERPVAELKQEMAATGGDTGEPKAEELETAMEKLKLEDKESRVPEETPPMEAPSEKEEK